MISFLKYFYPSKVLCMCLGLLLHGINTYMLMYNPFGFEAEPKNNLTAIWVVISIILAILGCVIIGLYSDKTGEPLDHSSSLGSLSLTLIFGYVMIPYYIGHCLYTINKDSNIDIDSWYLSKLDRLSQPKQNKDADLINLGAKLREKEQQIQIK